VTQKLSYVIKESQWPQPLFNY